MSSQFNAFAAASHRADLRRDAARTRRLQDRAEVTANPFPTILRSRRLGRLVTVLPSPERRSA